MSFRVWFLRMVWIVAAAVALSGCPGDDKDNGTDPEGDGPTLAVAVTPAEVTMGAEDASGDHDVKVTITSDDDAHKTAEVELSVACTEGVDAPAIATAKKDAEAGMADWEGQSVKVDAPTVCTYTAKALEKEATGKFTVNAAEEPAADTPAIALTVVENNITAGSIDISFTHEHLADAAPTFMVHILCADAAPTDVAAVEAGDTDGDPCTDASTCTFVSGGTSGQMCGVVVVSGTTKSNLGTVTLK